MTNDYIPTDNYNFKMPTYDAPADIMALNETISDIDGELKRLDTKTISLSGELTGSVTPALKGTNVTISANINNSAVTTAKIADNTVTTTKIVDGNVTAAKIADGAVVEAKIAGNAVTTAKINNGAVTTDKILDSAITNTKMANMNQNTIKARCSANAGTPEDISAPQLADILSSAAITNKDTPIDADSIIYTDSAASNAAKRITWTNIKVFLKTYFGTLYARAPASITSTSTNTAIADATITHTHALADNAVVTEYGVVIGQVSSVEATTSTVKTVLDTTFSLSVHVGEAEGLGTLRGDFNYMHSGLMVLDHIDDDLVIMVGDRIATSGLGGVFPPGLIVGEVLEIQQHITGVGRYAVVLPIRDINTIVNVFVVIEFGEAGLDVY